MSNIRMPRLSDSMEAGTIVRWLKATGDAVLAGEPVVEIETDKATMAYEAEASGVLEIVAAEGTTVALGAPIARLLPEGCSPDDPPSQPRPTPPSSDDGSGSPAASPATQQFAAVERGSRVLATPVARRVASRLGIELAAVSPSGRRGQIVKADVEAFAQEATNGGGDNAQVGSLSSETPPASHGPTVQLENLSRVQQTVARRMAESRALVPDFTLEVDVDMGACMTLRAQLAEVCDPAPSVNDLIIKACALALRSHPRANGTYRNEHFELHDHVNVGFAVAAQDALLVPVVLDADEKRLSEITRATRSMAARVRDGQITPADLSGATFTLSNLGMFGIGRFTAIINAPQAAILAVGAVEDRAVVRDGQLHAARMMTATLAADHRILYGADAAAFLTEIRDRLQAPLSLVV